MAIVSRIAKLRIDDVATHTTSAQEYTATAVVEQTAEGASVNVTVVNTVAVGLANPTTLSLNFYNDAGVLIRTFSIIPFSTPQTVTFWFTNDGTSTGAACHGTVEIALRAINTGANSYDVETDGTPNTPPVGFDTHLDRGYIIGTTTIVEAISNIALGGGKSLPASYTGAGGDSLFSRFTLGSVSYTASTLTATYSNGGPTGATNSSTAVTRDRTDANVVDNRFPLAVTNVGVTATPQNSPFTGLPYTVFTATTNDTISTDPRLTILALLQGQAVLVSGQAGRFVTPPMNGDSPDGRRAFPAVAYMSARLANARSELINGVTATLKEWDAAGATGTEAAPTHQAIGCVSSTEGGEAGWLRTTPNQLPIVWTTVAAGTWRFKTVITGPAGAVGLETHALSSGGTTWDRNVFLVVTESNYAPVVGIANADPTLQKNHLHTTTNFIVFAFMQDLSTGKLVQIIPANGDKVEVDITRLNPTTGRIEYVDATNTWTAKPNGVGVSATALLAGDVYAVGGDPDVFIKAFSAPTGQTSNDFIIQGRIKKDGVNYALAGQHEVSGDANDHSGYVFDGPGFVGFPTR